MGSVDLDTFLQSVQPRLLEEQKRRDKKALTWVTTILLLAVGILCIYSLIGHLADSGYRTATSSYSELTANASRREATAQTLAEQVLAMQPANEAARFLNSTPAHGGAALYSQEFTRAQQEFSAKVAELLEDSAKEPALSASAVVRAGSAQLRNQETAYQAKITQYNTDAEDFNSLQGLWSVVTSFTTAGKLPLFQ